LEFLVGRPPTVEKKKKGKRSTETREAERPSSTPQPATIEDDEGFARGAGQIIAEAVGPSEDVPPRNKRKLRAI